MFDDQQDHDATFIVNFIADTGTPSLNLCQTVELLLNRLRDNNRVIAVLLLRQAQGKHRGG